MACGLGTWFMESSQRCEMPGTTGVILPTAQQSVAQSGPFGTVVQTASRTQNPGRKPLVTRSFFSFHLINLP